jgi:hypothetical protein
VGAAIVPAAQPHSRQHTFEQAQQLVVNPEPQNKALNILNLSQNVEHGLGFT